MIKQCNQERWQQAQKFESNYWSKLPPDSDDWNNWWMENFDEYNFLKDKKINSIGEVGCGPYAKNLKLVMTANNIKPEKILLLDPLIQTYIDQNKIIKNMITKDTIIYNIPLEIVPLTEKVDLVICNNVLDHVYNVDLCMDNMYNLLNKRGVLILGQDLTNDIDMQKPAVYEDKGHPIKLDGEYFNKKLDVYKKVLFKRILERDKGRNPSCHYATLLFAGEK